MVWPIQQQPGNHMPGQQGFFPGGPPQQTSRGGLQQLLPSSAGEGLLSPEKISGFSQKLSNVQQVLKVVQSAAPIIQQYGPMVKNMPALLKMMKALNESDSESDDNSDGYVKNDQTDTDEVELPASDTEDKNPAEDSDAPAVKSGESTPKLFI